MQARGRGATEGLALQAAWVLLRWRRACACALCSPPGWPQRSALGALGAAGRLVGRRGRGEGRAEPPALPPHLPLPTQACSILYKSRLPLVLVFNKVGRGRAGLGRQRWGVHAQAAAP